MFEYRMIQAPPTITVRSGQATGNEAASYLQEVANQQAAEGWEFYRVDTVGVLSQPGCLGALLGGKPTAIEYFVITFRKPRS